MMKYKSKNTLSKNLRIDICKGMPITHTNMLGIARIGLNNFLI